MVIQSYKYFIQNVAGNFVAENKTDGDYGKYRNYATFKYRFDNTQD